MPEAVLLWRLLIKELSGKQKVKFYQIITYIRVTMRCARTGAGQCRYRSPWV